MAAAFRPEHARGGFAAVFRFEVEPDSRGPGCSFNINVHDGVAEFSEGEPPAAPTLTFQMQRETYDRLRSGELSGARGYFSGAVSIAGLTLRKIPVVRKFDKLFPNGASD